MVMLSLQLMEAFKRNEFSRDDTLFVELWPDAMALMCSIRIIVYPAL